MVSGLIFCFLMFLVVFIFVLGMNGFSAYALLYSIFVMYLYCRLVFAKREKKTKYRRIFQFVFAVLFSIAFISDLIAERGSMTITESAMSSAELPFCHIAIPQILTPFLITRNIVFPARIMNHYASVSSMLLIWIFVTLTVGRGWCSWICFYGGWEEGFSSVAKKRKLNLLSKNKEMREFQLGFLGFIVLASLCELSCIYCEWFCPFKLVTEYSPINSIPSLIAGLMFFGLFVALVIVLPILTKRRTQCGVLCPFGAFASLTDKASLFRVKIDSDKCKGCMKCAMNCKFGAIDIKTIQDKKGTPEYNCAKCGDCINVCPENAIRFSYRFEKPKSCHCSKTPGRFGKFVRAMCNPEQVFRFAAFTFGVVMSSSFSVKALQQIAELFIK